MLSSFFLVLVKNFILMFFLSFGVFLYFNILSFLYETTKKLPPAEISFYFFYLYFEKFRLYYLYLVFVFLCINFISSCISYCVPIFFLPDYHITQMDFIRFPMLVLDRLGYCLRGEGPESIPLHNKIFSNELPNWNAEWVSPWGSVLLDLVYDFPRNFAWTVDSISEWDKELSIFLSNKNHYTVDSDDADYRNLVNAFIENHPHLMYQHSNPQHLLDVVKSIPRDPMYNYQNVEDFATFISYYTRTDIVQDEVSSMYYETARSRIEDAYERHREVRAYNWRNRYNETACEKTEMNIIEELIKEATDKAAAEKEAEDGSIWEFFKKYKYHIVGGLSCALLIGAGIYISKDNLTLTFDI